MAVVDEFTTTLNKRSMTIRAERGVVSKADSDTIITHETSGGGGYVSGGTGHISAPTTTTKVTRTQRVYVTDEEGRDTILDFNDHVLAVREGHPLTMIRAFWEGGGPLSLAYFNHSTSQLAMRTENIRGCWGLGNVGAILLLLSMAALAVVGWVAAGIAQEEMKVIERGAQLWIARGAGVALGIGVPWFLFLRWRRKHADAFIASRRFQDMLDKVRALPAR